MAHRRQSKPPSFAFSLTWLVGVGLVVFGIFSLFLMLGWFAYFEFLAIAFGIGILGGLFWLYGFANPDLRWPGWASYLLFSLAAFFAVSFFVDFRLLLMLATAVGLAGLPFLILYIRRVWLQREQGYWWAALPAGLMLAGALTLLHFTAGWPPHMVRGLAIFTFMGGMTLTFFLIWAPNLANRDFLWLPGPIMITGFIALFGALDIVDMGFLAIPLILLGAGGGFLLFSSLRPRIAAFFAQAAQPPTAPPPVQLTPIPPPPPPAIPASTGGQTMPLDLPDIVPEADEAFGADQPPPATLAVSSPAFAHETLLPAVYTCDGAGISPPLTWDSVPEGTETFALICDTPNAPEGILAHWVVYNLPAAARGLPPGIVFAPDSPDNGSAGTNDFGQTGYSAPCPPPGGASYHYYFKLYALRTRLGLPPGATKRELVRAMQGHILATGQMMVVCRR